MTTRGVVVLRRKRRLGELEPIAGGPDAEVPLVEVNEEVPEGDEAALELNPNVVATAPSQMPLRIIQMASTLSVLEPGGPVQPLWSLPAIGADKSPRTGAGVKVAVLDTGIDHTHPAFKGIKLVRGDNVVNFTTETDDDVNGHGTHCAATIFGRDVNGVRIGVARGVTDVFIGKVLATNGGNFGAIAKAINWAYAAGAHVLSMSIGVDYDAHLNALMGKMPKQMALSQGLTDYGACLRLFDRLCEYVSDRMHLQSGMLVVAAAGNESSHPNYAVTVPPPAGAYGVISVGAIASGTAGNPYEIAKFSNRKPQFVAPGVKIISAWKGGGLALMDGTSTAAPHVAGVAALYAQPRVAAAHDGSIQSDVVFADMCAGVRSLPYLTSEDAGYGLIQAPA